MTASSGDPGETPQNGGPTSDFPAYETPVDPAYGPAYGSYPPPPPPPPPPQFAPPPQYGPAYPGSYPNPGYPSYPYYPGYPPPGTNSLAITSLIFSIFGLVPMCGFVFSIAGIVTGAVAMGQVKRTGQQGHGLAVAGLVIGLITLLLGVVMFAVL